ncbi:MAG: hypothetical protein U0X93_05410 [Anaerolineales bacterium]
MLACVFAMWAANSPVVYDYEYIYDRDTEQDLVFAFATALRINHPEAYEMIDPTLKPRLDEWMNTHQSKKCEYRPDFFMSGTGTMQGHRTSFSCFGYNEPIHFEVDNIVIKDMKVIDWGEVRRGD